MEMERTIATLNKLVEINDKRIEGYTTASAETDEYVLKSLFTKFIQTSRKCRADLKKEIIHLGGKTIEDIKTSGQFFRAWPDVKVALTGKDRKAILSACEYGEDKTLEVYDDVLKNDLEYLNGEQQNLVSAQRGMLNVEHNSIKAMRDSVIEVV
jgi:uncharacterized protein (TIGR02284 family)